MEFFTNIIDYFFYFLIGFAIIYWLFFTSSDKKFKDIKDTANTLRGIADDVDKAVDSIDKNKKTKNGVDENKKKESN